MIFSRTINQFWPFVEGRNVMQVTYIRRRSKLEIVIAYIWRHSNGHYRGYLTGRSGIKSIPPEYGDSEDRMTDFLVKEGYTDTEGRAFMTKRSSLSGLNRMYENEAWLLA
ncbi:hypothetical protein N9M10_00335 [Hellea sp.]|nr:hypothetical protein [Hellea sp.]